MTTTYRAAFGNPQAHRPVVDTLFDARQDTSSDAALAQALAEEENVASRNPEAPASPSGVKVHLANWEAAPRGQLNAPKGTPFQKQDAKSGQPKGAQQVSDAELAWQLQQVELASKADAVGTTPSKSASHEQDALQAGTQGRAAAAFPCAQSDRPGSPTLRAVARPHACTASGMRSSRTCSHRAPAIAVGALPYGHVSSSADVLRIQPVPTQCG
jgi:hypothetical protein